MTMKKRWESACAVLRIGMNRVIELHILFPFFAIVITVVLWWMTLSLIAVERSAAENAAKSSVQELMETYEAQVIRALREIDQELKLVKYAYANRGEESVLDGLDESELLPPAFLFTVAIIDPQGHLIASNKPLSEEIASEKYVQSHRQSGDIRVAIPHKYQDSGEWKLQFSRRLSDREGSFAGIAMLEVDASYFVSGYEADTLGGQGLLALLGTDGIIRVRRTGESVFAGGKVDYAAIVSDDSEVGDPVTLSQTPWDNVKRYMVSRQLFEFPLAVVTGLSKAEQLAVVDQHARTYRWRAAAANILFLLILGLLWRMSYALAESRRRESQASMAHAEQVEYLAYHDSLTGLPNRSLFSKLLAQSISQAHRYNRTLAVMFLDLDHFKHINDTLGHEAGDDLLKEVAVRLKECMRESDTVARLGGDEFVVVLPELIDGSYTSTVARKIIAAIAKPFTLIGQEFRVTASVGISLYPNDGLDEQTLTKNADAAMYQAKEEGKNNYQFYSDKLHAETLAQLSLESGLRHALEREEFQLYYQAKRDVRTGKVTGIEALLRWQHPDLGIVAPMQFIPLAEETGLILPIGKWVIRTACEQSVAWGKQGFSNLSMAVNLSAQQFFDTGLPEYIESVLKQTGMPPELLELEITESLLMRDVQRALKVLNRLKEIGVRIAIDDFGVGYSSLAMLRQFPLDAIKIDRSFIRDVTEVAEDMALTDAIVAMGRTLSLTVVAQGVETREQADFLRDHACNELQGFYFNRPAPAEEFTALLQTRSPTETEIQHDAGTPSA